MHFKKTWSTAIGLGMFAAAVQMAPLQAASKTTTVTFDPARGQIKWVGKKVTGQHEGTMKLKSGHAALDGNKVTGGEFVVDMNSLTVVDLKDPDTNAKLTGHLKSDDFFGVDKHPTATFVIKTVKALKAEGAGKPTHEVSGDLSIKGKTNPVTFPATIAISEKSAHADALLTVDRTLYDIRYGSGKFFENLGDKMIFDDFTLQVHLEGQR